MEYKWLFAPYLGGKGKGTCPSCKGRKKYSFYVDTDSGAVLSSEYGMCDSTSCAYNYSPYEYPPTESQKGEKIDLTLLEEKTYFNSIPVSVFKRSFKNKYQDTLSRYLLKNFDEQKVKKVLKKYRVGCANLFGGESTVFWNIAKENQSTIILSGKIMKYTKEGNRDKTSGYPKMKWVHNFYKGDWSLKQCLFGDFLLKDENIPVRVVESEKTAIILSILDDKDIINIASGGLYGLKEDKLKRLEPFKVTFYPDKGKAYDYWNKKINSYMEENKKLRWKVSNILETDKTLEEGDDLIDKYLKNNSK